MTTPSAGLASWIRFCGSVSAQARISSSFWRSFRWAGRAKAGHHDPAADVADEAGRRRRGERRPEAADHRLGVAHPRGHAEDHRDLPASREVEGGEREVVGLLGGGRLQHGDPGGHRVAPVVLLVLRRRHAGVVGGDQHERAVHAGVGRREERVGGHVHAHVLHGDEHPGAGEGRAETDLEGHLLVGRPLRAPAELGESLQDLGGWRAGVSRSEGHAPVERRQGHCLVTAPQPANGRLRRNRLHDRSCLFRKWVGDSPFSGPPGQGLAGRRRAWETPGRWIPSDRSTSWWTARGRSGPAWSPSRPPRARPRSPRWWRRGGAGSRAGCSSATGRGSSIGSGSSRRTRRTTRSSTSRTTRGPPRWPWSGSGRARRPCSSRAGSPPATCCAPSSTAITACAPAGSSPT